MRRDRRDSKADQEQLPRRDWCVARKVWFYLPRNDSSVVRKVFLARRTLAPTINCLTATALSSTMPFTTWLDASMRIASNWGFRTAICLSHPPPQNCKKNVKDTMSKKISLTTRAYNHLHLSPKRRELVAFCRSSVFWGNGPDGPPVSDCVRFWTDARASLPHTQRFILSLFCSELTSTEERVFLSPPLSHPSRPTLLVPQKYQ